MRRKFALRMFFSLIIALIGCVALCALGEASSADAVWPEHPGTAVDTDGKLILDRSHMDQGYVMVAVSSPTSNRMRVRVTFSGFQLMYDIEGSGDYVVLPLQLGSGKYDFELFENVKSSKYSAEGKVSVTAQLADENAAFLVSNQYVDYTIESLTVQKSDEVTAGAGSDKEIYQKVCSFIEDEFSYDFVRASTISSGTLPEVDPTLERRAGVCQDLSAVMICMLRVQGIPAKLMIGYADKYYHAWTMAVIDGQEVFYDPTAAIGCMNASKYQIERFY